MSEIAEAALLRRQFQSVRGWVEGTVGSLTSEQAAWPPPGKALPAGAHYAHILTSEDFFFNGMLRGGAPLMMSEWQGRSGISEPPPLGAWDEWAKRVTVDLDAARSYGQAVYAATDAYLAALTEDELARPIDLSALGIGMQSVGYVINALLLNSAAHAGEISCLKGVQGAQGYPF
jgi:hypothetical protein